MRRLNWLFVIGLLFVVLSVLFHLIHYFVFKDARNLFFYLALDIAFIPISVLLVTLIINRLLVQREKNLMRKKLNMVIGAFFSNAGIQLLRLFREFDSNRGRIAGHLMVAADWSETDFSSAMKYLVSHEPAIDDRNIPLDDLRAFLVEKNEFLLRLLENPNLLEHEEFTDLLWAIFHLNEELAYRKSVRHLPEKDYQHIAVDMKRAYASLIRQWIEYVKYLKKSYPHLFSLALRTNPFNPEAKVEIE